MNQGVDYTPLWDLWDKRIKKAKQIRRIKMITKIGIHLFRSGLIIAFFILLTKI